MGKKRKENKAKKQASRKRGGLWVASAVVALALFVGAWVYTESRSRSLENEPKAYQVAHDMPEVLDQLYCYCECDKHSGHRSLLSCYTDHHAANCDVCVNEALDGSRMMKQGYKMPEIKRAIDRKYSRM